MFTLLSMTNPLWNFIIGPVVLVGFGWWLRGRSGDPDPLGPYDLAFGNDPEWVDPAEPRIRLLGPVRVAYDWEKEDTDGT